MAELSGLQKVFSRRGNRRVMGKQRVCRNKSLESQVRESLVCHSCQWGRGGQGGQQEKHLVEGTHLEKSQPLAHSGHVSTSTWTYKCSSVD